MSSVKKNKSKNLKTSKNHQVLARKYRPQNFREFVGQVHVTKTLINALKTKRLHHAFLFAGTRGVGKTTIARILAKCFNCQANISPTPCGKCNSCLSIADGQSLDLIELDAASRTKVEDMREVLENAQYLPTASRYKIYLIDEVHMLSTNSFNALLKTLEEPPKHIKFLLATTDPHKLPITILSRCLQFNLEKINKATIEKQLAKLLKLESISFDKEALSEIARHGDGSMRDALSLLDQAIAYGGGKVELEQIKSMLGLIDTSWTNRLLKAIFNADAEQILTISDKLYQHGYHLLEALQSLLEAFHQLSIALLLPNYKKYSLSGLDLAPLKSKTTQAQVQLYYQIVNDGIKHFDYTGNEKQTFEITLLRLLSFGKELNEKKN